MCGASSVTPRAALRLATANTSAALIGHTELGNARWLVDHHGADLRYVRAWKRWHCWDGRRWASDETGEAERRMKALVPALLQQAAHESDEPTRKRLAIWAVQCSTARTLTASLQLAMSEPEVAVTAAMFDADPWLLNVANGTLDLRTLTLRPHRREDLLSKLAPVAYEATATCPRWLVFLDEIMGGQADLVEYLKRATGYALTGDVSEHAIFLLFGIGANGKTTYLETLRRLLGDYARQADFATFLATRTEPHIRNDLARLAGARFVTAVEAEEGRRFAEAQLKQLTGGDTITARQLYREHVEFAPQFKIWLAANHKPQVWGTDYAFWRRLQLIPFTVTIPPERQDRNLRSKLIAEGPGILNWALAGLHTWREKGLAPPEAVLAATRAYQAEQDVVGDFLADRCTVSSNGTQAAVEKKVLYEAYAAFCRDAGTEPVSARTFNTRIAERGISDRKAHGRRLWVGLSVTTGDGDASPS